MSRVHTPKFRVSYPHMFEPKLNDLNGKYEYSLVALFEKGQDLSGLEKAASAAAKDKWGDKIPAKLRSPFRDQGERIDAAAENGKPAPGGYERGAIFINLKSKNRPGLVDLQVKKIIDESEFYAGCYAIATINAFPYDKKANKGVSFGLGNVQMVAEGEPLGGYTKPEDDFKAVESDDSSETGETTSDNVFG